MPGLPFGGVWTRAAYMGLARVLVRSQQGAPGSITLSASAPGLQSGSLVISTTAA